MNIEIRKFVDDDAGIYYFKNCLNNKYYIGQAINIRKRLSSHISNCNNARYDNPLYRAIHKYGYENFEFGILQRVEKEELFLKSILDFWERYYVVLYNSYAPNGYNQTLGGDAGVLGLKMTEEQKRIISQNSKREANDGRNTVFCYNIETQETSQHTSLPSLKEVLGINIGTSSIKNLLVKGKYLIARTLDTLEEKKQKYTQRFIEESSSAERINGRFPKKITKDAIEDIINGMTQKEWVNKYKLCKASYSNQKRRLVKEGKMNFTRVYTKKASKEEFLEYIKTHTAQEASSYFDVGISQIYRYKKAYSEQN